MTGMGPRRVGWLVTLVFALLCLPAGAQAATFVVNNTGDGGDANGGGDGICETVVGNGICTLRAALEEANATQAADVVQLPAGRFDVGSELALDKLVTINGAGRDATFIRGTGASRIFGGVPSLAYLAVTNLTIAGGRDALGSAILFAASAPTQVAFDRVRFTDNRTPAGMAGQGMVDGDFNGATTLTFSNSLIDSNSDGGGGMAGEGLVLVGTTAGSTMKLEVTNTTFDSNTVGGGGGSGGGVLSTRDAGTVVGSVTDSTFSKSQVGQQGGGATGGGIEFEATGAASSLLVSHSRFENNLAGDAITGGNGAAVRIGNAGPGLNVVIDRTYMLGNNVGVGQGAAIFSNATGGGTTTITNSTLTGNDTVGAGSDAIRVNTAGNSVVQNSTIVGNTAAGGSNAGVTDGGAGTVTITGSILSNLAGNNPKNCVGLTSGGYNVTNSPLADCGFTATGDQQGVDAQLGPFQDNGGATLTFAPALSSPAIDRGPPAGNPSCPLVDQRGAPRPFGAACDAGALEIVPPVTAPAGASAIAPDAATLNATVAANASKTTFHFEYGPTAAYGTSTPETSAGESVAAVPVSQAVSGLSPSTTYHYRAVASSVSGTAAGADTAFTTAAAPSSGPKPVRGKTIVIGRSTGTVLYRPRGAKRFKRLTKATSVPVGSTIDTRKGRVELTSARDAQGTTQSAFFSLGLFVVAQGTRSALTDLVLSGPELKACGRLPRVTASAARARRKAKPTRRLFGSGYGNFRTKGYYGSATVRGTRWLVQDYCDRTTITVKRGIIDARDYVKRKTVRVRAGHSYTARARRAR
jgi:hypothetical protein